ncbi:Acyl-lipid (8-3)-desaturase [Seminavis robusta]|uniref:Acyl-lipid (8-3)-desaturase n=1 Tax=Seminavis robusta TaxID=568900 RepID=A0A9N8H3M7_9STRA|nr:Acyl-lipid (8-3)-desaturase [Seminavis robusta]|eukprot:Sro91_g047690.1 Acyl-lipid (8-3)-desaturase (489) ;mRNA; r:53544-55101
MAQQEEGIVVKRSQEANPNQQAPLAEPTWSSNVVFYPPSKKYWRIGNQWYDLSKFNHPGGKQILEISRDRFEDATFVFESHHHDYKKARKVLNKYLVPSSVLEEKQNNPNQSESTIASRPTRSQEESKNKVFSNGNGGSPDNLHHDRYLDANKHPKLMADDAFYSVLRQRVADYLKEIGYKDGGPTWECVILFWIVFVSWAAGMYSTWLTGSILLAGVTGILGAFLGAFGHNWVHQPKYKEWGWALLSLDTLGFSSEGWYREHLLQHHMYTNTPWDNHFRGTDPFLVTDPTRPRNFVQKYITPAMLPIILCFGAYGNYTAHLTWLIQGQEVPSIGKVLFPLWHYLFWSRWGLYGLLLMFCTNSITGNYYFTMALMNHNAEHTQNVQARNKSCDWGEAQLHVSADWSVDMNFYQGILYLWLNFHTVHHLFPKVDMSHHPEITRILKQTCKEFEIPYVCGSPGQIYKEMIHSFSEPQSLLQEIMVYAGGI